MLTKLEAIFDKYMRLEEQLSDPEIISDMSRYSKVNKEYKDLKPLIECYKQYKDLVGNIATARAMLSESDLEMKEMAREELQLLEPEKEELEEKIKMLMVPKDPDDDKNVIFEIRSGTGGDEASLFAGDLYRMYSRYFEKQAWKTEVISVNEGTVGGYNKLVLGVSGEGVYGKLKFESGAHRVQRVPDTEAKAQGAYISGYSGCYTGVRRGRHHHQQSRPTDRYFQGKWCRRAARQQNRIGCTYYAHTYRHCFRKYRRPLTTQKPRHRYRSSYVRNKRNTKKKIRVGTGCQA
ncbi:hypothetical protein MASR1M65_17930 [Saprospiraceae bacterium]